MTLISQSLFAAGVPSWLNPAPVSHGEVLAYEVAGMVAVLLVFAIILKALIQKRRQHHSDISDDVAGPRTDA